MTSRCGISLCMNRAPKVGFFLVLCTALDQFGSKGGRLSGERFSLTCPL